MFPIFGKNAEDAVVLVEMVATTAATTATATAAADKPSIPMIIMRRAEHLTPPWAVGEGLGVVDHVAEEEREEEEEEEGVEDRFI